MTFAMQDAMEVDLDTSDTQHDSPMAGTQATSIRQKSEECDTMSENICPAFDLLVEHMQSLGHSSSTVTQMEKHSAKPDAIAGRRFAVPRGPRGASRSRNFQAAPHATINSGRRELTKLLAQTTPHPHSIGKVDTYKPVKSIDKAMADFEQRRGGDRRSYGGRKRGRGVYREILDLGYIYHWSRFTKI